jgi:hypothetical protein
MSMITYFSQIGNNQKTACAIQKGLNLAAGYCDIFSINKAHPKCLSRHNPTRVGSPVIGKITGNLNLPYPLIPQDKPDSKTGGYMPTKKHP